MNIEVDGKIYEGWTSAYVQRSIEQASATFAFTATSDILNNFPVSRMASVKVYIGSEIILTGFVDRIAVNYDSDNHTILIEGRDKTSLLIDSSVQNTSYSANMSLKQLFEKVISELLTGSGITLSVIDNTSGVTNLAENINSEPGQSCFDFLEKYCRKKQVLFTSDGNGNVVLTRGATDKINAALICKKNNEFNNVLRATVMYDDSQRYYAYKCVGQLGESSEYTNENIANKSSGFVYDTYALKGKKLIVISESQASTQTLKQRAIWEANIRRAKSSTYVCTVQGHTYDGINLWEINKIVRVEDEFASIYSDMLIRSVSYQLGDAGTLTELELVSPDAYTLQASQDSIKEITNEISKGF